jgi:hypothetical protein
MTVLGSMNPDGVADQQIKVVDIGAYNVAVGILHRSGKAKQTAIAHSEITEIYYVIKGAGTFVTGGTMTGATAVAPEGAVVKVLVGPSSTGATIAGGESRRIGPGDVITSRLASRIGSARSRATWTTWSSAWIRDTCCPPDTCIRC